MSDLATNHLAGERSLYLRQHARNPVDWYPWGQEALGKARAEDKPLFLSIGYSACHWCHVMARESFQDGYVGQVLNRSYVSIKVDREERPDLDGIYMSACHMISGGGGWPLTIIATPDGLPFFAGTYFSKGGSPASPGLLDILQQADSKWRLDRAEVLRAADQIASALREFASYREQAELSQDVTAVGYRQAEDGFDEVHGGFEVAPKFPSPHRIIYLLRYHQLSGSAKAWEMAGTTLRRMQEGGLFDHVGFGFHRYSTDSRWLVPHFEKMLYDQAMLGLAYSEAFALAGEQSFKDTALRTYAYVDRDMTSPYGGFYSAESAESEGEEGRFYVWTLEQVEAALDPDLLAPFVQAFDVQKEGNFREEASRRRTGRSILHLAATPEDLARAAGLPLERWRSLMQRALSQLYEAREARPRPEKDDKVMADWNGLMVASLARSSALLKEPRLAESARRAADFLLSELRSGGRLKHRYVGWRVGIDGFLDDYAFLTWGLIELFLALGKERYLGYAVELADSMLDHFWNREAGGLFFTADDAESLIARRMEGYDGALPSGNSVAACALTALSSLVGRKDFEERARATVKAFAADLNSSPWAHAHMLQAVLLLRTGQAAEGGPGA